MTLLTLMHRWTGGIIGLLLAVLGSSGAILLWEDVWIGAPHIAAADLPDSAQLAATLERLSGDGAQPIIRVTFASETMGLHDVSFGDGGGAYLDIAGHPVTAWASQWERPELWLFDLHHHLFAGETGETITGVLGLIGLFFVISGIILWWRTRRTFAFRLWPKRMSRSAILRQHRDLGIVAAPLLLFSMTSGVMMLFAPVNDFLLAPWASKAAVDPVSADESAGVLSLPVEWRPMLEGARARFPEAAFRRVQLPRVAGDAITLRMRQPFEWTPNGRTSLRFDPADGRLLSVVDAAQGDEASRIEEKLYPLHAAKVGGLFLKVLMSLSGLALALLGSFAVYGFWFAKARRPAGAESVTG